MADIFVSYTSRDRLKAFWIGQELMKLGHTPRIHEWEIPAGGNIPAWMEQRHHDARHVLLVISKAYLAAPYSNWERQAAQWAAADKRPNFALPVFIEDCEAPTLLAHIRRCDLHGRSEVEARAALAGYLTPAAIPSTPVAFFGPASLVAGEANAPPARTGNLAGSYYAVSNIPISVPRHFLGRDEDLAAIDAALRSNNGRVAITALHGLRGVGKTTLAAAYAEHHRGDYRATWWIRAETESTMRADLVGLGVQLGWVAADEKEEPALAAVMERLRDESDDILLIYDNANNASELRPYMPRSGTARVIVTSNAPNWSGVAAPIPIRVWPKEIGADYLIAQAGRDGERDAALALSEALGGLPLAHEQAAAFCDRLGISLAEYRKRFEVAPAKLLDTEKDAPAEYHDRMTVAKTFELAIEEAAKLHPGAERLIEYAALLAPEPIPLYLFSEAHEGFGEPFASALAGDGLDEAVAALRAFGLVDRESIADERDPAIITDCIRLHRLVRQVAAARLRDETREDGRRKLIDAMTKVYPAGMSDDPKTWPRARRLDALSFALVNDQIFPNSALDNVTLLLSNLAIYRFAALADYAKARPLMERVLSIREETLGPKHPRVANALDNLASLLLRQGEYQRARPLFERAIAICEEEFGPESSETGAALNNLAGLLYSVNDYQGARLLFERVLLIVEKELGPEDANVARALTNLGGILQIQGDLAGAYQFSERALAICEKVLGPEHPHTATSLNNLAIVLEAQGNYFEAKSLFERALMIDEKAFGPEHPETATDILNLAHLLKSQGDFAAARRYYERALAIFDKVLGAAHPSTKTAADNTASVLEAHKCRKEAKALRKKFRVKG